MKKFIQNNEAYLIVIFVVWIVASILASDITQFLNKCNTIYPINYIFYSRLFFGLKNENR